MKMPVHRIAFLFAAVLLSIGNMAYPAGIDMKEGEWRISSEASMKMEGMSMPPVVDESTYCLTRDDFVPKGKNEEECRVVHKKVSGDTVFWRIECKNGKGEGEITYHRTTYKGKMRMTAVDDGQKMTMDIKLSGKYLGPCPKGQKSGPTGKTAQRMEAAEKMAATGRAEAEKGRAQSEKAMAEARKAQAEQAALARKAEDLVKHTKVPGEDPGAFVQDGFAITRECGNAIGSNAFEPGYYRVKFEKATEILNSYRLDKARNDEIKLDEKSPVPRSMLPGGKAAVKCGKGKITWASSDGNVTTKGGIVYKGKSFEGAARSTLTHESGKKIVEVVKVTGRWVGGRDYSSRGGEGAGAGAGASGRGYTAQDTTGGATGTLKDKLKNPVKGIRNLFGF